DVQQVTYAKLAGRLLADKQILAWTGPITTAPNMRKLSEFPGITLDDRAAKLTADWTHSSANGGLDFGYQHDANEGKGQKSARFEIKIPTSGQYEVRFAYTPNSNRASNVPVTIDHADRTKSLTINAKNPPPPDRAFISLVT